MSDTQTLVLISGLRDMVLLAVFVWLPVMNKERAFFGVRVDPELYRGEGRRTLNRYRLTLAGIFVLCEAAGFLLFARFNNPLFSLLACLSATGAALMTYIICARSIHPYAVPGTATRFASSIQARSLKDFTHWWLEVTVAGLTIAAFAICVFYYPQIQERMPVHGSATGVPNGWAHKSLAFVFFIPAIGLYMQIFFLVLKYDMAHARMTLPGAHTVEFLRGKERYLLANILLVDWVRITVALLFFDISLLIMSATVSALNRFTQPAFVASWMIVAVMLGSVGYFIWRMKRINDELKEVAGESYVERPVDEEHWRQGGLTYYNPDDSALVVEKLVGFGYTLNLAHPRIPSRLALLSGVPIFVAWALLSF